MNLRRLRQQVGSFFSGPTSLLTGAAALIGAVVAILTATGVIGGGGGSSHAESTTQNDAMWAAQANAICAKANDTIGALPNPHTIAASDIASYLETSVVLEQRMLRDLSALPVPGDKKAQVASFLKVGERMSDATSELANDVTLGDLAGAQKRAQLLSRLNTHFNNAAIAQLGGSSEVDHKSSDIRPSPCLGKAVA
jgi:hypothetical protein